VQTTYRPELWRDLYIMLGTTAGALIGLLFVVTSLHLDELIGNPIYRIRARNNVFYLLTMVIESALVLTPQPVVYLGIELLVIALSLLLLHLRNLYRFHMKDKAVGRSGGFSPYATARFLVSDLLGAGGGALLIGRMSAGLYLFTASILLFLVSVIINAWTLMLWVGQSQDAKKAREGTPS
jgi:hypothetical protein